MADPGYDPRFLDTDLAPPRTPAPGLDDDPALETPLDYAHFTVRMHPDRRLAWWVAWNIDGLRLFPGDSISRSGERFRLDPRIPADAQTDDATYADNDLDRGHVARRSDLLWGTITRRGRPAPTRSTSPTSRRSTRTSTSPDAVGCGACWRTRCSSSRGWKTGA